MTKKIEIKAVDPVGVEHKAKVDATLVERTAAGYLRWKTVSGYILTSSLRADDFHGQDGTLVVLDGKDAANWPFIGEVFGAELAAEMQGQTEEIERTQDQWARFQAFLRREIDHLEESEMDDFAKWAGSNRR